MGKACIGRMLGVWRANHVSQLCLATAYSPRAIHWLLQPSLDRRETHVISSRGKNLTQGKNPTQKNISDTDSIQALKEGRQGFVYTRKRGLWTFTARTDNKTLAPDRVIWRALLEIPAFFMENDPPQAQMCLRTHPILPTPQGNLSSLFHRIDGVCRGLWRSKNWLVCNFLK